MFKYFWNYILDIIGIRWNAPRTISGGLDMRFRSNKESVKRRSGCSCILAIIVFMIIIMDSLSVNENVVKETSDINIEEYQTREREKLLKVSTATIYEEEPIHETTEITEPITNSEGESCFNVDFVEGNKENFPAEKEFVEVALPCDAE